MKGTDDEDAAHGLHMTTLDDLIQAMMSPSPADFRNMQFMPSMKAQIYVQEMAKAAMDAMQKGAGGPGGSTNDLLGDDDDDGSDNADENGDDSAGRAGPTAQLARRRVPQAPAALFARVLEELEVRASAGASAGGGANCLDFGHI